MIDLGDDDAVGCTPDDGDEVVEAAGIDRVDPHPELGPPPGGMGAEVVAHHVAGERLAGRRDGVLEIEDQGIRAGLAAAGELLVAVARDEQEGPQGHASTLRLRCRPDRLQLATSSPCWL